MTAHKPCTERTLAHGYANADKIAYATARKPDARNHQHNPTIAQASCIQTHRHTDTQTHRHIDM